jgi:hypothetical protein
LLRFVHISSWYQPVGLLAYLGLLEVNGMKRLLMSFFALALVAGAAYADVPDPSQCECTLDENARLLLIPGGDTNEVWGTVGQGDFTLHIVNAAGNDIPDAVVEVIIGHQPDYLQTCYDGSPWTVKNTDGAGMVEFNIPGGGCKKHTVDVVQIRANGVDIREYEHVMSPDYLGTDDNGYTGFWSLTVAPADLAAFNASYQGGIGPPSCHDYDNNLTTGPADFAVFSQSYFGGTGYCP